MEQSTKLQLEEILKTQYPATPDAEIWNEVEEILGEDASPAGDKMMKETTSEKNGSLTLDLSGEISIDLKLKVGSQTIYISCDDENLMVQLGDGTSFRLPFSATDTKLAA